MSYLSIEALQEFTNEVLGAMEKICKDTGATIKSNRIAESVVSALHDLYTGYETDDATMLQRRVKVRLLAFKTQSELRYNVGKAVIEHANQRLLNV